VTELGLGAAEVWRPFGGEGDLRLRRGMYEPEPGADEVRGSLEGRSLEGEGDP
jgi:hypothetical protein